MGSFSDFLENELLDQMLGGLDYAEPATCYIALSTADPLDDASGLAEPGSNYVRKAVTNNKTTWSTASGGALSNAIEIAFVTATGAWGTITHFAVMDAASGGNMLVHAVLTTPKAIGNGDTAKFAIGDLDVTLD